MYDTPMERPNTYVNFYGHLIDLISFKGANHAFASDQQVIVIEQTKQQPIEIPVTSQRAGNVLICQIQELATEPKLVQESNAWAAHVKISSLDQYLNAYANKVPLKPARTVLNEQDLPVDMNW